MDEPRESVGAQIKKARKAAKLTQKKLSELTGIPEITIRQYEAGKYLPKYERALILSQELGISMLSLGFRSDESLMMGFIYDLFASYGIDFVSGGEGDEVCIRKPGGVYLLNYDALGDAIEELETFGDEIVRMILDASTEKISDGRQDDNTFSFGKEVNADEQKNGHGEME